MAAHTPAIGRVAWRSRALLSCAGLMGACGVAVGAAGAHGGGGDFARLSSEFLLVHAAAVAAVAAYAAAVPASSVLLFVCGAALVLGTAAFSGDLALAAFGNLHPMRGLAPIGGVLLLAGWVGLAAAPWIGRRSRGAD